MALTPPLWLPWSLPTPPIQAHDTLPLLPWHTVGLRGQQRSVLFISAPSRAFSRAEKGSVLEMGNYSL